MAAPREAIFAALFTRLQGATGVKNATRTNVGWDKSPPSTMPALMLAKGKEKPSVATAGLPTKWELEALVVLWCSNAADPTAPPSTQLNTLISALESALEMQPGETAVSGAKFPASPTGAFNTTLGGLCTSCYIRGDVEVGEGTADVGSVAQALIPITIITTA